MTQAAQAVALGSVGSAAALFATVSQYFAAPATEPQLKVVAVAAPVAPCAGEIGPGAGNGAGVMVKFSVVRTTPFQEILAVQPPGMAAAEAPAILSIWLRRQKVALEAWSAVIAAQGPLAAAYTWPEGVI